MKQGVLLLPFFLVTGLIDGYAIPESSHCKQENEPFLPYKTYFFMYNTETEISTPASTTTTGSLNTACNVRLNAEGGCKYTLNVTGCAVIDQLFKLAHSNPSKLNAKAIQFTKDLERYLVRFTMSDGAVETLHAYASEPPSILNFKRGIITSFITKKRVWKDTTRQYYNELRSDVQGTCPVKYRTATYDKEKESTLYMTKDTSRCQFPSRMDSPYSPFSLIWNTSFIHKQALKFYAECQYEFNEEGILRSTECLDRYYLQGQSIKSRTLFTVVQTLIKQKLSLYDVSDLMPESTNKASKDYRPKNIQYEFERIDNHHEVLPDIKQRVHGLMDKLLTDPEKPIDPNSANLMDELVELLRNSEPLISVMDHCWVSSTCNTDKYTDKEIQLGYIWKTALIQCNRAHCTKAFRSMLDWDSNYLKHVIADIDLNRIFFAWSNARIADFHYIETIIDIVKHKFTNRFSITLLSSIIYNFRKHYKDEELRQHGNLEPKHRTTLEDLLTFIKKPIGEGCLPTSGYKNIDVAAALQAYANVVPLYEFISDQHLDLDIFKSCINGKEDHWPISVYALQATKHARPTKELHTLLWKALKDPSLGHEDHVMAYKVLANKFGGDDFLNEIVNFLEESTEKGLEYNLRTFIVTHLRTVAKDRKADRAEFARAIRKAMVYMPNLFRAIPDEKPIENDIYKMKDDYYSRHILWDIRVDDDFIFDEGRFSTYSEEHYTNGMPMLNGISYGRSESTLFKEGSYFPYALWAKDYVELFGQKYNVSQFSLLTKGLKEFFKALSSHFKGDQNVAKSWESFGKAKEIFENIAAGIQNGSKSHLLNFPYKVDENILKHLIDLHKEKVHDIPETGQSLDAVYEVGMFDILLMQVTFSELPELTRKLLAALSESISSTYKSRPLHWKVVEAETIIPTVIGMSLNWTTDAYWFGNFKLETKQSPELDFDEDVVLKIGGSFSGLATLNLGVQVDLPGYASYGANSFSTVSTNVGAEVDFQLDVKEKKFKVQLELPQWPMQLLSYKRTNSLIMHYHLVDIPDASINRKSENWCSYSLSSLLGFKLCHSHSYMHVTGDDYHKQCSSLAGNSYFNYTTKYIAKHKVAFQFGINADYDESTNMTTVEAAVKSRDPQNADKFNTIVKWSHSVKKGEFKSQITAPVLPTFNIQATRDPFGDNGSHFKVKATIYPGETTYIDLQNQKTTQYIAESVMKSHLSNYLSNKEISVPITTTAFNYTSKNSYYGYSFKSHEFPETTYTDYKFQYKSLKSSSKSWPSSIFKYRDFWKEDGSAWLKFHREVKIFTEPVHSGDIRQSYNHIKLPKSTVQLATYIGPTRDAAQSLAFNLTHHNEKTNTLLHFINFTSSLEYEHKDGGEKIFVVKANTTVPMISMETKFTVTQEEKPITVTNVTWILRQEQLKYKPSYDEHRPDVKWWAPNTDAFTSEESSIQTNLCIKDDNNPEWKKAVEKLREEYASIIAAARKEYYSHFAYFKKGQSHPKFEIAFQSKPTYISLDTARYKRHVSINSPTENFSYDVNLSLDFSLETELFLWKSTLQQPNEEPVFYLFNVSSPPAKGFVYVTEDLNSKPLKRNSQAVISYIRPYGEISINSQSPVEPLFNLELKAKYTHERTSITAKHYFMDIDFESNSELPSYYTSKTDFNSKNLNVIPNMQWVVKYPNSADGISITFKFPDVSKNFYVFGHTELNATRLLIDICSEKNCTISDIDSDSFIAEIDLSLEDPQMLTRTVSFNPQELIKLLNLAGARIGKTIQGLFKYFNDPLRVNSIIVQRFQMFINIIKITAYETVDFFAPFLKSLGKNFIQPFLFAIDPVWTFINYPISASRLHSESSGYSWCTYVLDYQRLYTREIEDRILEGWYIPGPIPGKSYVATTILPVYWTQFNKLPLQLSPLFYRKIQDAAEELTDNNAAFYRQFHDKQYERHALFTSSGDIYTFDGRVRHYGQHLRETCPYLLSHDYDDRKFSIYYQYHNVHFLFPDLSLTIGSTGTVYINDTSEVDLPYSNWNGNIRVVLKGNLTELITSYDMKAVCSTNDFYCLFYTTESKFNALTGLLGNNNDNPMDEPRDAKHYELSGPHDCEGSQHTYRFKQSSSDSSFTLRWSNLLWQPSSPTLACHDIVSPTDFFAAAYTRSAYDVPCSLMNGYLAVCDAKDIAIGISPCFKCKSRYSLGSTWNSKVESRVDVVFIIDLTYRNSSKNFVKGLESLADSFEDHFVHQHGYTDVSFGLTGYNGNGYWNTPQQHTMNGKLLANYDDFVKYGLKTLTFDGPKNENQTAGLLAIEFAAGHYNLGETSTHIHVIMTPKDLKPTELSLAKKLYENYGSVIRTLHVFSNYEEISDMNMFGMKADGIAFSSNKGKYNFNTKPGYPDKYSASYPKGMLAEIASLTKGAAWQLPYLEKEEPQPKIFNKLVSLELLGKAKEEANHCRKCHCSINDSEQPFIYCETSSCNEPVSEQKPK